MCNYSGGINMISKKAQEYIDHQYEADKCRSDKYLHLDWKQYAGKAADLASLNMRDKAIEAHRKSCPDLSKGNDRMCRHLSDCDMDCKYMNEFIDELDKL